MKKGCCLGFVFAFLILIIIACIGGIVSSTEGSDSTSAEAGAATNSDQDTSQSGQTYGIGTPADVNGVAVTLTNVTESNGNEIFSPDEGKVFLLCEFDITNNSSSDISVSSLISFETYVDDYSTTMDISAVSVSGKNQLDGTVAAGKKMNGVIGYQAPAGWSNLEIRFTPDFWSGKDAIFTYSK